VIVVSLVLTLEAIPIVGKLRLKSIQSVTHAEADAFQQAFEVGLRGGKACLTVDRSLCRACGQNVGVKGMAKQLGLSELEIISPDGHQTLVFD
jgi:hypothetical protein